MSASKLVKPNIEYIESYLEALDEYHSEGRYKFVDKSEIKADPEKWIDDLNNGQRHLHKKYADWVEPVPETILWLVKAEKYIGTLNIRHRLNWHLEKWGGHVNFNIRPSMREKGFGKKILNKAMPFIYHVGVEKALLTIDPDNKAAIRIAEFSGAVEEDHHPETDKFPARTRYWLDCS